MVSGLAFSFWTWGLSNSLSLSYRHTREQETLFSYSLVSPACWLALYEIEFLKRWIALYIFPPGKAFRNNSIELFMKSNGKWGEANISTLSIFFLETASRILSISGLHYCFCLSWFSYIYLATSWEHLIYVDRLFLIELNATWQKIWKS